MSDKGLVLEGPWPRWWKRVVPFDEIARVEWVENGGRPKLRVHRSAGGPVTARAGTDRESRELYDGLTGLLEPPEAGRRERLPLEAIRRITAELGGRTGIRPSAVVRFLTDQAFHHGATDIHFEWLDNRFRVRFRLDGLLVETAEIHPSLRSRLIGYLKNAAGLAAYQRETPLEGRLDYETPDGNRAQARLSTVPTLGEESVVLRLFDGMRGRLDLQNLGFSPQVRRGFEDALNRPRGLVLVSGPSGSGKTTTLYAALKHLMNGRRAGQRAVSLEDPIEYPLDFAGQIEVSEARGLTFDRLLSRVLRQDVDVIVIGEIRDAATAGIAVRAALTGHLILSTVHCGRAAEAPRRLIDLGVKPSEAAEALEGVLTQRLLRVLCPECKRPDRPSEAAGALDRPLDQVFRPAGCDRCLGGGYRGRTAAAEWMPLTDALRDLIRNDAPTAEIRRETDRSGFHDLLGEAWAKAAAGTTAPEEIRRVFG